MFSILRDLLRYNIEFAIGAVLTGTGESLLRPFAVALVAMAVTAALGGVASFLGLRGKWKRHEPEPGQVS